MAYFAIKGAKLKCPMGSEQSEFGKTNVVIKGYPALIGTCKCMCLWGGPIEVAHPGQDAVYEGGPMTITITDPTMETLQSLEGMESGDGVQGALGSGLQPASLLPSLQTAIGDVQMSQIPSFVTEMKEAAETLLQKAVGAVESGKEKSNDIRSSAKADKDNIAKELKEKAESKCKEIESYKAIVNVKDDVDGKAFQGQKITYEAIICGKDGHVNEECDVRWAIKVGENGDIDKDELKSKCGKSIVLEIKPEWADKKEITIMPYLNSNSPDEGTSKKTKVEKWELPKVIIESEQTEGTGANGKIARDMHFGLGEGNKHTDNFNLYINLCDEVDPNSGKLIRSHEELRDAIKEDLKYDDDELFDRFNRLVTYVSKYPLRRPCLEFIKKMKSLRVTDTNTYKYSIEKYSRNKISEAAFRHKDTDRFVDEIEKLIKKAIKDSKGDINKIEKIILSQKEIKSPVYSSESEGGLSILMKDDGLMIAVNDTWGYRVKIIDYTRNSESYECKLEITIFDHFGLDYEDIKKFGTKQWPAGKGFRAWFILQHYRGYRPFVNVMTNYEKDDNDNKEIIVHREIKVKGQL